MSRRRKAQKRELIPDPRYSDIIVSKFSNSLMQHGRKAISEKLLYGALEKINKKTGQEALKVFKEAIENVKPQISPTPPSDRANNGVHTSIEYALSKPSCRGHAGRRVGRGATPNILNTSNVLSSSVQRLVNVLRYCACYLVNVLKSTRRLPNVVQRLVTIF